MKNIYIWYSGATDITGMNLVEKLTEKLSSDEFKVTGGTTEPTGAPDLIIGYGTKISRNIAIPTASVVLNHPNAIRVNRNKFGALQKMEQSNVQVAIFESISKAIGSHSSLMYPVIARTNYHQGGRGLAICASLKQLKQLIAVSDVDFGYAQELLTIDKEYRIHVFNDKIIRIAEKVIQRDLIPSYCANYSDKIMKASERNGVTLDDATVKLCLKIISKDLTLPDFLVRSNKHGWCFKEVDPTSVSTFLQEEAKEAVKSIGLNFGAVDCVTTDDDEIDIVEVNSGPGLQGGTLTVYVDSMVEYITNLWAVRTPITARATNRQRVGAGPLRTEVDAPLINNRTAMQEELNGLMNSLRTLNEKIISVAERI